MITCVQRRRLAWLVAISLMTVGSLAAHSLAYRIVETDARPARRRARGDRPRLPRLRPVPARVRAGHRRRGPGLASRCAPHADRSRPRAPSGRSRCCHRSASRSRSTSSGSPQEVRSATRSLEPTFLVGLALQLPFAPAALLAARTLTRAAVALGRALAPTPRRRSSAGELPGGARRPVVLPARPFATADRAVRGPPARARH